MKHRKLRLKVKCLILPVPKPEKCPQKKEKGWEAKKGDSADFVTAHDICVGNADIGVGCQHWIDLIWGWIMI